MLKKNPSGSLPALESDFPWSLFKHTGYALTVLRYTPKYDTLL